MEGAKKTTPFVKGGISMKEFMAKNPKQLDLCLRLLYSEQVPFAVTVEETDKRKIVYCITIKVEDEKVKELEEKYRILIS